MLPKKKETSDAMVEASRIRVYFICLALSLFSLVPMVAESYFPNTAHATMEAFIQRSVQGVNATADFTVQHTTIWKFIWAVYLNLEQFGMIIGAFLAPLLTQYLGRPRTAASGLCFAIPGRALQMLSALPDAWPVLFIGKAVSNIGLGIIMVILPIFVSEISEKGQRDRLGILNPMGHAVGALLGAVLGLQQVLGGPDTWLFAYGIFMLLLFPAIPILMSLPESPVFLLSALGPREEVNKSLTFYQGDDRNLKSAMEDAKNIDQSASGLRTFSVLVTTKIFRKSLFLAASIAYVYFPVVLIQHYSTIMLEHAGFPDETAGHGSILIKCCSIITFVICFALAGTINRRRQLIVGYCGVCVCMTAMFVTQLLVTEMPDWQPYTGFAFFACILCLQVCLNFGIRPVFWAVVPEMFPFKYRAVAKSTMNILSFSNMIAMSLTFLPLLTEINYYSYLIYSVPLWLCFAYCATHFPDMANSELHEIFHLIAGDLVQPPPIPPLGSDEKRPLKARPSDPHPPSYGSAPKLS